MLYFRERLFPHQCLQRDVSPAEGATRSQSRALKIRRVKLHKPIHQVHQTATHPVPNSPTVHRPNIDSPTQTYHTTTTRQAGLVVKRATLK